MRKLIKTETYSGLKGELIKLTGKDIIIRPTIFSIKYKQIGIYGYQILINDKLNMLLNKNTNLRKAKSIFDNVYFKESKSKIWKKEK